METIEVTGKERPMIRRAIDREHARYNRREWPEKVLTDPDLAAEVATGGMARESLVLQVEDGEGPLTLEGDPVVLAECLDEVIVEMVERLDPIRDDVEEIERAALRIATLAAESRRLSAAARGRMN